MGSRKSPPKAGGGPRPELQQLRQQLLQIPSPSDRHSQSPIPPHQNSNSARGSAFAKQNRIVHSSHSQTVGSPLPVSNPAPPKFKFHERIGLRKTKPYRSGLPLPDLPLPCVPKYVGTYCMLSPERNTFACCLLLLLACLLILLRGSPPSAGKI